MSVSQTFRRSITVGGVSYSGSETVTSGQEILVSETIPANSTNLQVALAFDKDKIKSIWILADAAMTLEFNNSTTGVPTITLVADVPFDWVLADGYFTNPFTAASVTTLYVTSSAGGTLQLYCVIDPT